MPETNPHLQVSRSVQPQVKKSCEAHRCELPCGPKPVTQGNQSNPMNANRCNQHRHPKSCLLLVAHLKIFHIRRAATAWLQRALCPWGQVWMRPIFPRQSLEIQVKGQLEQWALHACWAQSQLHQPWQFQAQVNRCASPRLLWWTCMPPKRSYQHLQQFCHLAPSSAIM